MFESDTCKMPLCDNAIKYPYPETRTDHQVEGYCSLDCMVTDLRKLKCPACNTIMEFDSETAFFTCSKCGQKLR